MALSTVVMDFSIVQSANCKKLIFIDQTGQYNVEDNPTGYPTDVIVDETWDTQLHFTLPDGSTATIANPIAYPDIINAEFELEIIPSDLGLSGTTFPDGLYTIKYKITMSSGGDDGKIKFITKKVLFSCTVRCCVEALFDDVLTSQAVCKKSDVDNALFAFSLLKGMQFEAGCASNETKINEMLESLQAICEDIDCGCGCQ